MIVLYWGGALEKNVCKVPCQDVMLQLISHCIPIRAHDHTHLTSLQDAMLKCWFLCKWHWCNH